MNTLASHAQVARADLAAAVAVQHVDYLLALVLAGMRQFPGAMRAVRRLGGDLFPAGPYRILAQSYITGNKPDTRWLTGAEKSLLREIQRQIPFATLADTETWAIYYIRLQAERRHQHLLASALRWAAERVDEGIRLAHVRGIVSHAFDIAQGDVPFDLHHTWETTP